ncbi:hypothetical protein ElyMa_006286100 [Elysia marginata]|uniref:Uncharacterized protein n=1 Tax=Elysia marginata TaxID=1093978 RepID=A0AAV4HGV8_9GAST|nr:hypothetical protein ElyMa_006286100 [Elysia marginata]
MPHATTITRRKMKEENPQRYQEYLKKNRESHQRMRLKDVEKQKWDEETHTRAQIEEREKAKEEKSKKRTQQYKQEREAAAAALALDPSCDDVSHTPKLRQSLYNLNDENFYTQDSVSRILPHSRYATKHGPARIMNSTIKAAHAAFLDLKPEAKIGLTLFQSLRPKNCRLKTSVPLESCLCIYCINVRKLFRLLESDPDLPTVLPRPQRDHSCELAKMGKRRGRKDGAEEKTGIFERLVGRAKQGSFGTNKGNLLCPAPLHCVQQFKQCRQNPEQEVVMVQDFGENRKAAYSAEIKSAHLGKQQIAVHPIVSFYRRGENVVRESLIFLTDDTTYDHHAVQEFTHRVGELRKKLQVKKLTIWSDGAASQYKGRGGFHDLTLLPHQPQRCYYGSEHGIGESDGETGVLSQALKRATYQGFNFSTAKDMVEYMSENHGYQQRQYLLVESMDRTPLDDDIQTIPVTRKYHQFQAVGEYVVQAWRLACFCTACNERRPGQCVNSHVVCSYTVRKCKLRPEKPWPTVGDYVKLTCQISKVQKSYNATSFTVDFSKGVGQNTLLERLKMWA